MKEMINNVLESMTTKTKVRFEFCDDTNTTFKAQDINVADIEHMITNFELDRLEFDKNLVIVYLSKRD